MSKVCDVFGVKRVEGAFVGIELEVEGENLPGKEAPLPPDSVWKAIPDGSLRNGIELVFKKPLSALEAKAALKEMEQLFKEFKTVPEYSFRTSTHVHVNFSNMELEVVKVFCLLFLLFENSFVNFCKPHRKGNRFCLRTEDSYAQVGLFKNFLTKGRVPSEREGKYSVLNLCTLSKYGTLEVRSLEGTNDWERIYLWARALLRLRKTAKDIGTREKLLSMSHSEIASTIFNTEKLRSTFLKEGWKTDMDSKKSYLSDLFYTT